MVFMFVSIEHARMSICCICSWTVRRRSGWTVWRRSWIHGHEGRMRETRRSCGRQCSRWLTTKTCSTRCHARPQTLAQYRPLNSVDLLHRRSVPRALGHVPLPRLLTIFFSLLRAAQCLSAPTLFPIALETCIIRNKGRCITLRKQSLQSFSFRAGLSPCHRTLLGKLTTLSLIL